MSRAFRAMLVAAAAGVLLALSACGPTKVGTAAIVGDSRLSTVTVNAAAEQVVKVDPSAQQNGNVAAGIVQAKVLDLLTVALAQREGITWTQGDVDNAVNRATRGQGIDQTQVYGVPLINGAKVELPAADAKDYGRDLYLQSVLLKRYGGATNPGAQQRLVDKLTAVAKDVGVRINPRYGTFDASKLTLQPGSGGLWVPARGATPAPAPTGP